MSDESQENVRKMRELLAKSQAPKGNAEQVRHVTADRGGIAVHAGGSVHIGMSPVAQRKPFFNFGRLLSLYSLLLFFAYIGLRMVPIWRSQPEEQSPVLRLYHIGEQVPLGELLVVFVVTTAIAAGFAALTRWAIRG
ncbi:hypothetical protein [Xanthomonas campestris]|uniref:hypothetical protein n=1 Tax=Xanthomonas campestris TaxID=339 RepID=UPI001E2CC06B|nr:hypothetical protein [Xanthomonas campestris]MCC8686200.1 hypothetical protein [Xanthomonas campestris]MCW2000130.1 hypothetical protein [Xanthomonas campestris]MEA9679746.1 hypothetical protein [Xanthomonas campestris pv. raphani]MEA9699130.1 hypothetical protein [Xanthomonas campestris pv. raphani]MEA9780618.1 hypothetical protein [Xanthomonas campestris pv. raphani]